jgi:hypothetical protein
LVTSQRAAGPPTPEGACVAIEGKAVELPC